METLDCSGFTGLVVVEASSVDTACYVRRSAQLQWPAQKMPLCRGRRSHSGVSSIPLSPTAMLSSDQCQQRTEMPVSTLHSPRATCGPTAWPYFSSLIFERLWF